MSKQAVIKLIEFAENNSTLRNQLYGAPDAATIIAIASEKDYQFTEAELLEVMKEKQLSFTYDEELSEEQLEAVVGGKADKNTTDHQTKTVEILKDRRPDLFVQ